MGKRGFGGENPARVVWESKYTGDVGSWATVGLTWISRVCADWTLKIGANWVWGISNAGISTLAEAGGPLSGDLVENTAEISAIRKTSAFGHKVNAQSGPQ